MIDFFTGSQFLLVNSQIKKKLEISHDSKNGRCDLRPSFSLLRKRVWGENFSGNSAKFEGRSRSGRRVSSLRENFLNDQKFRSNLKHRERSQSNPKFFLDGLNSVDPFECFEIGTENRCQKLGAEGVLINKKKNFGPRSPKDFARKMQKMPEFFREAVANEICNTGERKSAARPKKNSYFCFQEENYEPAIKNPGRFSGRDNQSPKVFKRQSDSLRNAELKNKQKNLKLQDFQNEITHYDSVTNPVEAEIKKDPKLKGKGLFKHFRELRGIICEMKVVRKLKEQRRALKDRLAQLFSKVTFKSKEMHGLEGLLKKFLLGRSLSDEDLRISNAELVIFVLFLVKKKYEGMAHLEWTPSSLENLRAQTIVKRREQNYKVILKRFLKIVIADFNRKNNLKKKDDAHFYTHFFAESIEDFACDWQDIRFQTVFNETRIKKMGRYSMPCSKRDFALAMSRSGQLMSWLNEYLEDRLVVNNKTEGIFKEYMQLINRKVALLLFKWRESLYGSKGLAHSLLDFVERKIVNDKVKLPWSLREIQDGDRKSVV